MSKNELSILLVEDEREAAGRMRQLLEKIDVKKFRGKESASPTVTIALDQTEADRYVYSGGPQFDVVILDLKYPDREGLTEQKPFAGMRWLPELKELQPRAAVAIQTAYPYGDEMNSAVMALRDNHAHEFIPKGTNWTSTEARLATAWERAWSERYKDFLYNGYKEFLHSRIFRSLAEDARDEVYRRGVRFRNLASAVASRGCEFEAEEINREYNDLSDEIVAITAPVDDSDDHKVDVVPVKVLLEGLQVFHSRLLEEKGVKVCIQSDEGTISTYHRDLRTALHELIENAGDAAEIGAGSRKEGQINIVARQILEPRKGFEIVIRDNGPGFTAEALEKQFQRGFSTKEKDGRRARGMGLYVARRFLNRIFGSIAVRNTPDLERGAEAVIFVPDLSSLAAPGR